MALARIIAPQGLMNTELKSRAVKEVARVLKATLGVGGEEDDTGIFTMCVKIDDGQCNLFAVLNSIDFETNPPNVRAWLLLEDASFLANHLLGIGNLPPECDPSKVGTKWSPLLSCDSNDRERHLIKL